MASSDWNINTDIYDIVDSVKSLQKRYIEDEDETTLSLGIFGFIADTEAKKIQTSTIMAGQLGNEMFPTRANLTKNVLTHAAYNGITNINAVPARITITLCIKTEDIAENLDENGYFYLDSKTPIFIDEYEFHLDYDIKILRKKVNSKTYSYSAQYIVMDENDKPIINRLSDITNPYLKQPFILNIGNDEHVGIQCTIRQCTIEETIDNMTSDSIIENKTYSFQYDNQIADFNVTVVDNGQEINLNPYIYGSSPKDGDAYYCWYLFTSENTIRITFDSMSYIPGLNSEIYIKAFTTLGSNGNFEYLNIDNTSEGLYINIDSDKYQYKGLTCYLVAVTDSHDGSDRKSKTELQSLIPKAAMGRGNITTETDLNNYFNLINTDTNRLLMRKKVDNQLDRIWYGYFLLKDDNGNIIPSNTINILMDISDTTKVTRCKDGRYLLPAGSTIRYDANTGTGVIVDASTVPELYSDQYYNNGYYYYTTVYNIVLCEDPVYCSYFMTACNYNSFFVYDYVNQNSEIQFIANRFYVKKNLLTDQDIYNIRFGIAKSINDSEYELYKEEIVERTDPETGEVYEETVVTQNTRIILVLYKNDIAYRWVECTYDKDSSDPSASVYYFYTNITSNSEFDDMNRIKVEGLNEAGSTTELYGYIDAYTQAKIYIVSNMETSEFTDHPREELDKIAPGYEDYTITNIYSCANGIRFFEDMTTITDTKVEKVEDTEKYLIYNLPVIGKHYLESEVEVTYLLDAIEEKKAYIDYCLSLVENSMNVDFKVFNTYGPSLTYRLENGITPIGHVDILLKFKLSLKDSTDITITDNIKKYIKSYIENINDISDFHAPNIVRDIINEYEDRINFIEFIGFNTFDEDKQHIVKVELEDHLIPPEFINIRNYRDKETLELVPYIDIEVV